MNSLRMMVIGMTVGAAATFASGQGTSPLQQYWATFNEGDSAVDVRATLDGAGPTIFDGVLNELEIVLEWDSTLAAWGLTIDGVVAADLITDADEWDRPTFAALFDANDEPMVFGFGDVDNNGILVIDWNEAGVGGTRMQVSSGGAVAMATCRCNGTGGTVVLTCTMAICPRNDACRKNGPSEIGYCQEFQIVVSSGPQ